MITTGILSYRFEQSSKLLCKIFKFIPWTVNKNVLESDFEPLCDVPRGVAH